MSKHARVLDAFQRRLTNAVTQSPLLRARTARTGRLLDLTRLRAVKTDLPQKVLDVIIKPAKTRKTVAIDLQLRPSRTTVPPSSPEQRRPEEQGSTADHLWLHQMLDERLRRHAEMARRETGVHALWLAYPLFFAGGRERDDPGILAPVFLWPASIATDTRSEGRFLVGRSDAGPPQLNPVLATWVRRQFDLELPIPDEEDLLTLDWHKLRDLLAQIANRFNPPLDIDPPNDLTTVPNLADLKPEQGPGFIWSAVLGFFRFPNEAILADLEAMKDQARIEGVVAGFVSGTRLPRPEEPAAPPEEDRYLIAEADFSQEQAVWKARLDPGVVIHGPPGTGKSQAIVNIIADALAHGRRVLMVCQKQAATRVVLERLRAAGLGDLCLEIHDAEGDRQEVFKAVREQVEKLPNVAVSPPPEQRADLSRQIRTLETELNAHARGLHETDPIVGLAYRDVQAIAGTVFHSWPTVRELPMLRLVAERLTARDLDDMTAKIEATGLRFRQADPVHNPWRCRQPHVQPSGALRNDVAALLPRLADPDQRHVDHVSQHGAGRDLPLDLSAFETVAPEVVQKLRPLANARDTSLKARLLRAWLEECRGADPTVIELQRTRCQKAVDLARQVTETSLKPSWDAVLTGFSETELQAIKARVGEVLAWEGRWQRFFSWPFQKAVRALRPIMTLIAGDDWWRDVHALRDHLLARDLRQQFRPTIETLVPGVRYRQDDEQLQVQFPTQALTALQTSVWLCEMEKAHPWLTDVVATARDPREQAKLIAALQQLELALKRLPLAREVCASLRLLSPHLTDEALRGPHGLALRGQSIQPWLDAVRNGLDGLDALVALDAARPGRQGHDKDVLDALEQYEWQRDDPVAGLPAPPRYTPVQDHGKWWLALVRYSVARTWLARCLAEQPLLRELGPDAHALKVEQLAELLRRKRALETDAIRRTWLARQLPHRDHPWKQTFKLRGGSKGEATRLREAVTRSLGTGLLDLRPVWLVNPETVSQVFPLTPGLFHVVIFDEASQCPLEQAIPSMYRGQNVVISGDEKQLPPTGFFSANLADDLDEEEPTEESDAEETPVPELDGQQRPFGEESLLHAEDLLEAAVGNLPESYLRVHYRSEHPALIEFSNQAFYSGRLEVPPARRELGAGHRPITYHNVGGRYENQTNAAEADKVIEVLERLWAPTGVCPTVGVVTFNQPQRELIEDRIADECKANKRFAAWLERESGRKENNQDVGFFVKNLENVQGDERDVMIFSTTFGVNPQGRFVRNFGPLSASGGERRLNVAVTRAKRQLLVVGSMPIDRVAGILGSADPLTAVWTPASYLQMYLAYAEAISAGDGPRALALLERLPRPMENGRAGQREPRTPLERAVYEELSELAGNRVECGVGAGGFRIDLAVRHTDPAKGYVLGVECDGGPYFRDRSARNRDAWRREVLGRLGWKLHRVWSVEWWDNRSREVQKLRQALLLA